MKNHILWVVFLLPLFTIAQDLPQVGALRITFPTNRTVIQRNTNNQATISIAGQYIGDKLYDRILQYRIIRLNTQTGTPTDTITVGTKGYKTLLATNNVISSSYLKTFLLDTTLSTGWYRLDVRLAIKIFASYITLARNQIFFGVGDVYLIAGQSNAAGYYDKDNDPGIIQYSETYKQYHAINAITQRKELWGTDEPIKIEGLPTINGFSNLQKKIERGTLNYTPIYPRGQGSWYWGPLANRILESNTNTNLPILFFNTAEANTSLSSWADKYWRDEASNYTLPPVWANDTCTQLPCLNKATYGVYKQFRSSLQMYGHILGLKSILWHQGERDAQSNPTSNFAYYTNKMNDLIAQSRTDIGNSNLSWLSSEVSYYYDNGEQNKSVGGSKSTLNYAQQAVWNPTNQKYQGVFTDDLGADKRNSVLKIHFTGETLKTVGDRWFDKNPMQANPVSGQTLLSLTITQNGSSYRLTAPSGYDKYFWVENENGIYNHLNTNLSQNYFDIPATNSGAAKYITCYAGQSTGEAIGNATDGWNLKLSMTQPFIIPGYENVSSSLVPSKNLLAYTKTGGNNSFVLSATNLDWQALKNVSWLSFKTDEDTTGGDGNYPITILANPNTDPNDRTAFITLQQQGGGVTQMVQIYQEGLNSCPTSLNLTSPNNDYSNPIIKKAQTNITANNKITGTNNLVQYKAGNSILFTPGFVVDNGVIFKAEIEGCIADIPWQNSVIGSIQGTSTMTNGTLTMSTTGNISNNLDNIPFYYNTYSTDVTVIAKITSITAIDGMRAGIMLRSSTDQNAKMYEFILDGNGNVGKLKRRNTNDNVNFVGYAAAPTANTWLKMVKTANTIQCFVSTDGNNYNEVIGWDVLSDNDLGSTFLVGLINYNSGNSQYSEVTFDSISVNGIPVY